MFDERRYSCTEATTKSGKTSGGIIWLGEQAFDGNAGQNYWWIAPIFAQAKIAFDRMCDAITREARKPNINELRIDLVNGTRIWFKSGENSDSLYGEDVYAAVIDEASRMKETSWHAVRSTLTATKGRIRLIGNVHGRKNWFYKMCRRAEAGAKGMGYHKITWKDAVDAGILDATEIDDARDQLPPSVFRELYEAEAADDEGNPFGIEAIRKCTIAEYSKRPVAAWGWDVGKHRDWTVGIALDQTGRMVRMVRFQKPWAETKREIIASTAGKPALIDATGVGDPIAEELVKLGNYTAFVFTQRSKQDLMEVLTSAIQQQRVGLTNATLLNELESFEYEFKGRDGRFTGVAYSAPPGMHDDCVCALALATKHLGGRGYDFKFQRISRNFSIDGAEPPQQDPTATPSSPEFVRIRPSWEDRGGLV